MSDWKDEVQADLRMRGYALDAAKLPMPHLWKARPVNPATGAPYVMPGFKPPAGILASDVYVPRGDGTNLRLLVLRRESAIAEEGGPNEEAEPEEETTGDGAESSQGAVGVLWIHGGGYVTGIPEMAYMGMPPHMVRERPCVVVCPDYRLAPEMPFPGGLEDCHLALGWLRAHADELGVRSDKLFVGGESAGGGLTAALCIYERDLMRAGKDGVRVACQMPLYPMLDDRPTSSSANNEAPVWDSRLNRLAWDRYLEGMERERIVPYAVPARETDYADLPPAITFVGSLEPFLDETVAYVANLRSAGVPTDFREYRGCYHGFDMLGDSSSGASAREFFVRRFSHACDAYEAPQSTEGQDHA